MNPFLGSGLTAEIAMDEAIATVWNNLPYWQVGSAWLILPIVAPLAAALTTFVIGYVPPSILAGRMGIGAAGVVIVSVSVITWKVWHEGIQTHLLGNWPIPLGIALRADGLTCSMLLMSAVVGAFVSGYALGYFTQHEPDAQPQHDHPKLFWPLWMLLWSALNALFLSGDVFNLYVALELLTLSAIGLIILAGTRAAVEASLRYLLVALAGSLFYLAGVALLYGAYATLDIDWLRQHARADDASRAALLLMMIGLMLKTALFPFHYWLPPAHGSAPAPVSAVLSGLVVKGSFYILLRLWFEVFSPELSRPLMFVPAALAVAAILWGALQAFLAERLKMLVAYSTVSQIGYLFLVFALARSEASDGFQTWCGGVLFALSHACAKGSLFLAAGTVLHVAGHDRIRDLPAVARHIPTTFFSMGLAAVALMGLPPTASFIAKWLLIKAAFSNGHPELALIIVIGGLLAASYLFRVLVTVFTDPQETNGLQTLSNAPTVAPLLRTAPRLLEQTTLGLAVISLLLGFATAPMMELLSVNATWTERTLLELGR